MGLLDDILKSALGGLQASPQRALLAERGKGLLESIKSAFRGAGKASAEPAQRPKADFSDVKAGSSSTAPKPAAAAEETYTVVSGDSLSKIAKRFYGDANDWRRIYEANREVIGANPDLIRPGQKLSIPKA
jgi:nucleoid-associated protein YgaU